MKKIISFSLMWLTLFVHAQAQQQTSSNDLTNENLLISFPDNYKIAFEEKKENNITTFMIPSKQTLKNWTELITVNVMLGRKQASLSTLLEEMTIKVSLDCKGTPMIQQLKYEEKTYYHYLDAIYGCEYPDSKKSEYGLMRFIRGNDSAYVIQKTFRGSITQEKTKETVRYLASIKVCDSRIKEQSCQQ